MGDQKAGIPDRPRDIFFEDPTVDLLVSTILTLTGELSVTRQRLSNLETLLASKDILAENELDSFVPQGPAASQQVMKQYELIDRVMKVVNNFVLQSDTKT